MRVDLLLPHTLRPMRPLRPIAIAILVLAISGAAEAQTHPSRTAAANDRQVAAALMGLGVEVSMDIHGGLVYRAFEELYPHERYDRFRLSPMQARAVAYVSLILAVAPGRDMYPVPHPVLPDHTFLAEVRSAVYDLAAAIPSRGSLFLSDDERGLMQRGAIEIGRMASQYGCGPLETAALELNDLANESMPERSEATTRIDELRRVAAEC